MVSLQNKTMVCCQPDSISSPHLSAKASADVALAVESDVNEDLGEGKLKSNETRIPVSFLNSAEDDEVNHSRSIFQSKIVEKVEVAETVIKREQATYARNDMLIKNLVRLYALIEPVIVSGILSLEHTDKSRGRASGRTAFVLSGLVSGSIVVLLCLSVFEQFRALKHGRQLQQQRDSDIDGFFSKEETSSSKRRRFPNYGEDIFEETSAYYWGAPKSEDTFTYYCYWWGSRVAFLVLFISISACVMVISYFDSYI